MSLGESKVMRIRSTKNISETKKLKIIVYGDSGVGKTTLLGTLKGKILLITAEGGEMSLADKDIDIVDITLDDDGKPIRVEKRIDRLKEVYTYLTTDLEARKKYDWICADSITEISACLIKVLEKEIPDAKNTQQRYGKFKSEMTDLIKAFRDMPYYNCCFTALPKLETDKDQNRFISIDIIGALSRQSAQFWDAVLYLAKTPYLEKTKRCIVTGNDPKNDEETELLMRITQGQHLIAKVRGPNGGGCKVFEAPNLQTIVDKIRGKYNDAK